MTAEAVFRCARFPGMVRYFVQVYTQVRGLLYRSPREIHPLEVRHTLLYQPWYRDLTRESCQRQTVFYTPSTITISQGEKIRGRLSCAPNTKNNRDLDIRISYETDGTVVTADYKMCVVFPFFAATSPRLVNTTDRWSGVDCIFMFILLHWLIETSRVVCACSLFDDIWWFGAGSIQVLSDTHTDTSLEYHVVDVRRNAILSVSVVPAGAATAESGWSGRPHSAQSYDCMSWRCGLWMIQKRLV